MKFNINRHIPLYASIVAFCAMMMLAACSSSSVADEPGMPDDGDKSRCMMSFYVNLGIRSTRAADETRATPPVGDQYVNGNDLENFIDLTDYQVYLFSTDNKLIAHLTDPDIVQKSELDIQPAQNSTSLYQVKFRIDRLIPDAVKKPHSFKILLLANWGKYPASLLPDITTIDDLTSQAAAAISNFNPEAMPDKIPFFGIQQYNDVVFELQQTTKPTERLLLLRAFAKIDVYDHVNTKMKIQSVKLSRFNTRFFNAPVGVFHENQYTGPDHYGYDFDFVANPSLPVDDPYSWETADELPLVKTDDSHFIAYIPEYKNAGRTDTQNRAKLILDYGDDTDYIVEFKYYDNPPSGSAVGDYYDIRRNYWYQFIVNRQRSQITISADVLPYHAIELNPDFGLPQPND